MSGCGGGARSTGARQAPAARRGRWLLLGFLMLTSPVLRAAPLVTIDAVLGPVWASRGGTRHALAPGAILEPGQTLITGSGAGARATLADGTVLRLGPDSALQLVAFDRQQRSVQATLRRGRLRYTAPRAVPLLRLHLSLGPLRCDLHGADALAFVTPRPGVLLLAGDVLIGPPQGQATWRSHPDTRYTLAPGGAGVNETKLGLGRAGDIAGRLDLPAGAGVRDQHGRWLVSLASLRSRKRARHLRDRLSRAGIAAYVQRFAGTDGIWYRVAADGFVHRADAERFARSVRGRFRIGAPWIRRRR